MTIPQRSDESRLAYLTRLFLCKSYTLDGEVIRSMRFWVMDNEIETGDAESFAAMAVGESMNIGGGAFATFTLTRTR